MEKLEKFELKEVSAVKIKDILDKPIIRTTGLVAPTPDYLKIDDMLK